jgi:hypothetical protein
MWKKKIHSRISRGSNDLELVSFLRNMSGKKKVLVLSASAYVESFFYFVVHIVDLSHV